MSNEANLSDYDRDKIAKQALVKETLAVHCTAESPFEEIRAIALALARGEEVRLSNLSGGYTNYTYKIAVGEEGDGETKVFAKLCFPRAFWNPDPDYVYDTNRIVNEKIMLESFANLAPGCAAKPYMLIDLEDDMKILITGWAPGDEQLAK